jgi:hypothetical protein
MNTDMMLFILGGFGGRDLLAAIEGIVTISAGERTSRF